MMQKKYREMSGKRFTCRESGRFYRCTEVKPKGKTSARFALVREGGASRSPYDYTWGDLGRMFKVVAEDFAYSFDSCSDRLKALVDWVDTSHNGRLPYQPGHFTEMQKRIKGKNGEFGVDSMTLASPFGSRDWRLVVHLYGEPDSFELKATPEDMKESGGYLWPAFKKQLLAMVNVEGEGDTGVARTKGECYAD